MPELAEHSARVLSPASCSKEYGRQEITSGVIRVACRLKDSTKWATQSYRFQKTKFTAAEARAWLKEHKIRYTLFEAATD